MSDDISLYRKYRPQNFSHLVGQDHIRQTLLNALRKKQVAHAYLFCGPRGTGKTTAARLVSKGLNCLHLEKNAEPCNSCDICRDITEGRLIDIIEIDAASNRGIDEIRDLREKIQFAPTRAAKKVYIIDEVHMLTKEAFNALLKTLEEPPAHAHFILATTEAYKIPETIISRCQRFDFKRIQGNDIVKRLQFIAEQEKIFAEEEALILIAQYAEGGLRDAIGLFEQMVVSQSVTMEYIQEYLGVAGKKSVDNFLHFVFSGNILGALEFLNKLYEDGADLSQFTKTCMESLRIRLLQAVSQNEEDAISRILELISLFQEAHLSIGGASIPQLPLEMALIQSAFGDRSHRSLRSFSRSDSTATPSPLTTSGQILRHKSSDGLLNASAGNVSKIPMESMDISPSNIDFSKSNNGDTSSVADSFSHDNSHIDDSLNNNSHIESSKTPPSAFPTLSDIRKLWPRVLDHIVTPAFRRSLEQGEVLSISDHSISLGFSSEFHLEKVQKAQAQRELENSLFEVFAARISVNYKTLSLGIDIENGFHHQMSSEQLAQSSKQSDGQSAAQRSAQSSTQSEGQFVTQNSVPSSSQSEAQSDTPDQLAERAAKLFGGELIEED
ncbi:DNA polymerase III subunit gamma/tau [Candidatus Peregrinibacteria bacterium]|nr:DNA polymerase III subunit gamma/tau [Candidatus Peregrinibacteria bacterium]